MESPSKNEEPIDPQAFVVKYGQERFGFTPEESKRMWQILKKSAGNDRQRKRPERYIRERGKSRNHRPTKKQLASLKPKNNIPEFEHLRLMFDLRVQYLTFKEIENRYESSRFERNQAETFIKELEPLIIEARKLDKTFSLP